MQSQEPKKIVAYGPYSPIKCVGNMCFVSGQVGVDPNTKLAKPGIKEQTKQVIDNLINVLNSCNLNLNNVVKTTVYLTNIDYFAEMNEVYTQAFNDSKPARATVAVKELPKVGGENPILIEIEAIAVKGDLDE